MRQIVARRHVGEIEIETVEERRRWREFATFSFYKARILGVPQNIANVSPCDAEPITDLC